MTKKKGGKKASYQLLICPEAFPDTEPEPLIKMASSGIRGTDSEG